MACHFNLGYESCKVIENGATTYQYAIVNISLFCIILRYLTLNNIVTLKSKLGGHSPRS